MGDLFCQAPCHDDIAALVALDQRALGGLWSAEGYGRELDSPNSCLLMLGHRPNANLPNANDGSEAKLSMASIADPQHCLGLESAVDASAGCTDAEAPVVLGLGCYWAILDEAHITVLAVDPCYQRRGLGKWLLVHLLADACGAGWCCPSAGVRSTPAGDRALTRATLEVRPSNSRALALYESFGFETLGRRRRYYSDGEDALILWQNSLKTAEFGDRLRQQRSASSRRLRGQGWQIKNEKFPANRT